MDQHPIQITFGDDLRRSRLTTFFRPLILFPHMFWMQIYGIGAQVILFLNWWATLFSGISPEGFHAFLSRYVRYVHRVTTYSLYMSEPYPPFSLGDPYSTEVHIGPRVPQNRFHTFFRNVAAVPALLIAILYMIPMQFFIVIGWFAIMITGRMPEFAQNWGEKTLRYAVRLNCYIMLLTATYPNASEGTVTSVEPTTPTPEPALV